MSKRVVENKKVIKASLLQEKKTCPQEPAEQVSTSRDINHTCEYVWVQHQKKYPTQANSKPTVPPIIFSPAAKSRKS